MLQQVLYKAFIGELGDLALLLPHNLLVNLLDENGDLRLHLLVGAIDLVVNAQVEVLDQFAQVYATDDHTLCPI